MKIASAAFEGVCVLEQTFLKGNVATAGSCFSSQLLAPWLILQTAGYATMADALSYVGHSREQSSLIAHLLDVVKSNASMATLI